MWRGISLANKCLLLFGAAVVLIIVAALAVPWVRMTWMVDESQLETSRALVQVWERRERERMLDDGSSRATGDGQTGDEGASRLQVGVEQDIGGGGGSATIVFLTAAQVAERSSQDEFIDEAWRRLTKNPEQADYSIAAWRGTSREYRYAKAPIGPALTPQGLIVLTRTVSSAATRLLVNTVYLLSAGLMALGLAVLVFYLITTRLILSPVRELKETAENVREGNLTTRSAIDTGDEFEELSETFNQMLEALSASQDQLRAMNNSLDLKVSELSERNVELHQAAKLKGDFLANVSHELRTPLNSILGFAEMLDEQGAREEAAGTADPVRLQKRRRYISNIATSARSLLEMINGLLEMAKVEAGKSELRIETIALRDTCEALAAMMRPMADKRGVHIEADLPADLPTIETDAGKLQQIIFNLLSNAIKFSGSDTAGVPPPAESGIIDIRPAGKVCLRAELLPARGGPGHSAVAHPDGLTGGSSPLEVDASIDQVRISVLDNGPGIAPEDQKVIFEKFRQLDTGHTRRHTGTGLGLAICKELTALLQGEIMVESQIGQGAMFSVILPVRLNPERAAEMHLEMKFRGALAAQKS